MKPLKAIIFFLALSLLLTIGKGQFIQDSYISGIGEQYVKNSLVKIVSTVEGRQKNATGFCFLDESHIVTALHAVAGSKTIVIKSPAGQSKATIEKIYKKGDLALLKLDPNRPLKGLQPLSSATDNYNRPTIWGFPLNQNFSGGENLEFKVTTRPIQLKELIVGNDGVIRSLDTQGYPQTDAIIFNVVSTIHPGHSGAPILNEKGQLVAIADGGLRKGTAGINWAIPANYLEDLQNSEELTDAKATDLDVLHCVAGEGTNLGHIDTTKNKDFVFGTHLNQLSIQEAIETLPRPQSESLTNAANQFFDKSTEEGRIGYNQLMRAKINVYLDESSGVYFATPSRFWKGSDAETQYTIYYRDDPHTDIPAGKQTQVYCQTAEGALGFTLHMEKTTSFEESQQVVDQFVNSTKYSLYKKEDTVVKDIHEGFQLTAEQHKEEYSLEIFSSNSSQLEKGHMVLAIATGHNAFVADLFMTNNVETFTNQKLEDKDFVMMLFCLQITGLSLADH